MSVYIQKLLFSCLLPGNDNFGEIECVSPTLNLHEVGEMICKQSFINHQSTWSHIPCPK